MSLKIVAIDDSTGSIDVHSTTHDGAVDEVLEYLNDGISWHVTRRFEAVSDSTNRFGERTTVIEGALTAEKDEPGEECTIKVKSWEN